ncbi:M23 family metallopeptidase [Salinimicrobium terrae]|uniref:M23 family metallopeptidase n=1 Tax=Salinimicrobium terrae TaxID=470866 RepID=UPI00041C051E|nr:M23 family metallopeptidase [Salinimicrobium terrae]
MKICSYILLFLLITDCSEKRLPKEKFSQTSFGLDHHFEHDTAYFTIQNTLYTPVRISISSRAKAHQDLVKKFDILIVDARTDTIVKISAPGKDTVQLKFHSAFGDPRKEVNPSPIAYPFPKNKRYKVIQGYNGSFSHKSDYSRYAIDFNMKVGDTVCSADDGYVVGVIKDYKERGNTPAWRDYANFITLFHPESGLYIQYVHLMHNGSFVQVGDRVEKGQPIGLSGMTGYTSGPHLHFNVLKPANKGVISTPVEFEKR